MPTTEAELGTRRRAALKTPSGLGADAVKNISGALNALLADVFALYIKTKNFHWHVSGPHFRDYHLLLDEHADQIFGMTDDIAERVRKIGGTTIRSIGQVARLKRLSDNDADFVDPLDMLAELPKITARCWPACGKRMTSAATRTMWPPPACWRPGLTRWSGGSGSCLRRGVRSSQPSYAAADSFASRLCLRPNGK